MITNCKAVDTRDEQLELWVKGESVHLRTAKDTDGSQMYECCPDMSCCEVKLLAPLDERLSFISFPPYSEDRQRVRDIFMARIEKIRKVACHHSNRHDVNGVYQCVDCGVRMCTDCGTEPAWWYTESYCKRDEFHNGNSDVVRIELDPDAVLEVFNGDEQKARAIIAALENGDVKTMVELIRDFRPQMTDTR